MPAAEGKIKSEEEEIKSIINEIEKRILALDPESHATLIGLCDSLVTNLHIKSKIVPTETLLRKGTLSSRDARHVKNLICAVFGHNNRNPTEGHRLKALRQLPYHALKFVGLSFRTKNLLTTPNREFELLLTLGKSFDVGNLFDRLSCDVIDTAVDEAIKAVRAQGSKEDLFLTFVQAHEERRAPKRKRDASDDVEHFTTASIAGTLGDQDQTPDIGLRTASTDSLELPTPQASDSRTSYTPTVRSTSHHGLAAEAPTCSIATGSGVQLSPPDQFSEVPDGIGNTGLQHMRDDATDDDGASVDQSIASRKRPLEEDTDSLGQGADGDGGDKPTQAHGDPALTGPEPEHKRRSTVAPESRIDDDSADDNDSSTGSIPSGNHCRTRLKEDAGPNVEVSQYDAEHSFVLLRSSSPEDEDSVIRPSIRPILVNPQCARAAPRADNEFGFQLIPNEVPGFFYGPHSPSPPQALLVPESLFHNIKVYFESSCRNMNFDHHEELLTPNGAKLDNALCNDFDSYCFTATMLLEKGLHVEFRHALSKASALVEQILRAEHPRTLACFLEVFIHFRQTGLPEVHSSLCDYIKKMSAKVTKKGHPWGEICRLLGELDSESLDQAMAQIWKCTTDTFDRELGTFHRLTVSVRLDYIKRVVSNHLEEERLLRDLLALLGGSARLPTPRVMLNLAHNLNRRGLHDEAEKMARKVLSLFQGYEMYASRIVERIECLKIISRSQFNQGNALAAEQTMRDAIGMIVDQWGIQHSWVPEFKNVLEGWLRVWGRKDDANTIREEIEELMGKDEIDE